MRNLILLILIVIIAFLISGPGRLNNNRTAAPVPGATATSASLNDSSVKSVVNTYQSRVVSIIATKDIPVIKQCVITPDAPLFQDPYFGDIGDIRRYCTIQNQRVETSGGTGFVVDSRGVILTNKHVVADTQAEYTVIFNDGKQDKIVNIYRDPNTDVALVKINRFLPSTAKLGDSDREQVGDFVVAMGNALGQFQNSASFGIISGLNRTIIASSQTGDQVEKLQKVMQTDAAINPGNSGGPLIALNGDVIGMNTAAASQGQNIGFALPINNIKLIISKFIH